MSVERVKLSKNGVFIKDYQEEKWEKVDGCRLIPFLNKVVELEDDFTLLDLFRIIEVNQDEYNLVFSSHLGNFSISSYIEDIFKECPMDDRITMDYLEVYWDASNFDFYKFEQKHVDTQPIAGLSCPPPSASSSDLPEINIGTGFGGWGAWDSQDEVNMPSAGGIGIEFTPLRKIRHLPLKLNQKFVIHDEAEDFKELVHGRKEFSVYDMLSAIFDEISFCGDPATRDAKWEEIEEDFDKFKKSEEEKEKEEHE